jgi:hypothetical protein
MGRVERSGGMGSGRGGAGGVQSSGRSCGRSCLWAAAPAQQPYNVSNLVLLPPLSRCKDKVLSTAHDRARGVVACRGGANMPFPIMTAATAPYPIPTATVVPCPIPTAAVVAIPLPTVALPLLPLRRRFLLTYGFCRDSLPSSSMVVVAASRLPSPIDGDSGGHPPPAHPDPVLMVPQGAYGGAQSTAVMRSMESLPPGWWLRATASSTPMNFKFQRASISLKQQRDVMLKAHIASVYFKCFRGIL